MSTALSLPLMSVDQFDTLPDPPGDYTYELHFGELVAVGRPKRRHQDIQRKLRKMLEAALDSHVWLVDTEMSYGLAPGFDARAADVGVTYKDTWRAVPPDQFLIGSPILLVHVKSPSNRDLQMEKEAILHIAHGAYAVLLVKPEREQIVMITATARTIHSCGETITLPNPLNIALNVTEVFAN